MPTTHYENGMAPQNPFWILPLAVCVEAATPEEAIAIAADEMRTDAAGLTAKPLPYPGGKRVGGMSGCPSFCYTPSTCAGRRSCPKNYACSE